MNDWTPILLSFKLACITTIILAAIGIPVAYWLSNSKSIPKTLIESVISLPLVLPPSVLGFYLLLAFSPNSTIGRFMESWFDVRLAFSFSGLIIASVVYSLPFMIHPVQAGFQNIPSSLKEASYTLGVSPFRTFLHVMLPNIKPALLTGIVLTFAHTIGEFGIVLMIGGSIPGVTKVASIAIYDEVESMNYAAADFYAIVLVALSMLFLIVLFWVNKKLFRKV
ncbi:MAG: molybdate ABC transporter permease subunit [Cytophagales bacterium]|nr:molybdate ABC transporter permease subunit [Cytophaga sp.]